MASDSAVNVSTLGDQTGIVDWVALRIDFAGFESVGGGMDLISSISSISLAGIDVLAKVGGLMYFGHGEKFTLFELWFEAPSPAEPSVVNGDPFGVETASGDAVWFSSITMREAVLGGVGGRADRISTMI
jgi:hypothetical protein